MKHLLSTDGLDRDQAIAILDTADRLKQALLGREVRKLPTLRGRTVITMFYENSTRTRVSFEIAGKWMSADVINVSSSGSSVSKGESLRDTALTLQAAGADCVIVRHPASGAAHRLAGWLKHTRADADGLVTIPTPWKGRYLVIIDKVEDGPADLGGKTVSTVTHIATLSFVAP